MNESALNCLTPQIREMYETLMQAGETERAQSLIQDHSETIDYLTTKRRTVYNLWIYNVAKALETKTCTKEPLPCHLCLLQARDVGGMLWALMYQFLNDLKPKHWGSPWEMLDMLQKVLESSPRSPLPPEVLRLPPTKEVVTPRIVKSPKIGAQYAARNDSD